MIGVALSHLDQSSVIYSLRKCRYSHAQTRHRSYPRQAKKGLTSETPSREDSSTPPDTKQTQWPRFRSGGPLLENDTGMALNIQSKQQILPLIPVMRLEQMHKDRAGVERSLDLELSIHCPYYPKKGWERGRRAYMEVHFQMLTVQSIFLNGAPAQVSLCQTRPPGRNKYAIGLFRPHLLQVLSPNALISLRLPSRLMHRESSLMRSTAFSNCHVLLFGEKTSE